ncbi:HlyD family secretion protein [Loktanella sp. SALINAS62]|uniref:HlyD family secretion protein n=1 Tax=Loktanella sp. SALINAS62 TaxID=2706124 RepID=UPI001B8BE78D|nr:HlyD family secretion protein [Loktanella sp. SALINAS62]MBS1301356.1 HlyD family secretion protein [Loktanella sp. SALINAS62]
MSNRELDDVLPAVPAENAKPGSATPEGAPRRRAPLFIMLAVFALLGGTLYWTAASDHFAPGTSRGIVSSNVTQVAPRVSGRVVAVEAPDNGIVEQGETLFRMDPRSFEIAVEAARTNLAQAVQGVAASSAQIEAAQAQVAQARVNAEDARRTAERQQSLLERGIVSTQVRDQAQAALDSAEATITAAEANAESARQQLGAQGEENTAIRAAGLALEQAEYDLLSTTVVAPSLGLVTNLHLTEGQFVNAGAGVVTFINADAVWITADLRENQLLNVNAGDAVTITFDALPGRVFEGRVDSIGWGINPGRSESGGLPINAPSNQWFEPARKMPVRIVLDGGMEAWPSKARLGGKAGVLIHATDDNHFVTRVAAVLQQLGSYLSALY